MFRSRYVRAAWNPDLPLWHAPEGAPVAEEEPEGNGEAKSS
jgi:hypothetical protein